MCIPVIQSVLRVINPAKRHKINEVYMGMEFCFLFTGSMMWNRKARDSGWVGLLESILLILWRWAWPEEDHFMLPKFRTWA